MRISSLHATRQQPSSLSRKSEACLCLFFSKMTLSVHSDASSNLRWNEAHLRKVGGKGKKCQIDLLAYFSIKTDCMKDLLGGEKKELFMDESVTLRRDIAQAEMTKPFLIHDGSVFFFFLSK